MAALVGYLAYLAGVFYDASLDIQGVAHDRLRHGSVRGSKGRPGGWLLLFTIEGAGRYRYRGSWFDTGPGDILLLRRDQPVAVRVVTGRVWDYLRVRFGDARPWQPPSSLAERGDGHFHTQIRVEATRQRIADAASRLIADLNALEDESINASLRARSPATSPAATPATTYLAELSRNTLREILLLTANAHQATPRIDLRVRDTIELMERDLTTRHTLASLAEAMNLSPSRIGHLFTRDIGLGPIATLQLLRLRQAARQLRETDIQVATIAIETGFGSPFHLSRQFRLHYGTSPRSYRQRHRT